MRTFYASILDARMCPVNLLHALEHRGRLHPIEHGSEEFPMNLGGRRIHSRPSSRAEVAFLEP